MQPSEKGRRANAELPICEDEGGKEWEMQLRAFATNRSCLAWLGI